jgi:hypothetical protein
MESMGAVQVELREHDRRLNGMHGTLGRLGVTVGDHSTEITRIGTQLEETRKDLGEIKEALSDTRRALYIVASTMVTFTLSIVGLTATLLNG